MFGSCGAGKSTLLNNLNTRYCTHHNVPQDKRDWYTADACPNSVTKWVTSRTTHPGGLTTVDVPGTNAPEGTNTGSFGGPLPRQVEILSDEFINRMIVEYLSQHIFLGG